MKHFIALFTAISMIGIAHAASVEDMIADCNDCHGADGISTDPDVPTIAGQSAYVLEDAMMAYADESRPCASSEYRHGDTSRAPVTMCEVAAGLSEDDIAALGEHYSALPFKAAKQEFDASLVEEGAKIHNRNCEKCHSDGGSNPDDDAGLLAGQWTEFLRQQIAEYRSGERPMSKKMAEKMELVDDAGFEALINYYASQGDGAGGP